MRFILITATLLVFTTLHLSKLLAQPSAADSLVYRTSVKNALSVYHQFLQKPSGLYNGGQYISYTHLIKDDHPYFISDSMSNGDIFYDSVLFENVPMFYDLVKEQVVINDPYKIYKISLISEKVNAFSVLNHKFVRLQSDSLNHHVINTGFYDLLYQGTINLYERELKHLQEVIINQELFRIIIPHNTFYLEIDKKFYPVNRKASLLKLLKNRKRDIQQFMRKNKLNYRKNKENTLIKVMIYYDSLMAIESNHKAK